MLEKDPLVRGYSANEDVKRLKQKPGEQDPNSYCGRSTTQVVEDRDFRDYWRENSKLNDSQLWLFDQLYVHGRNVNDIAEELGVSVQSIYLRKTRLIEKIQEARRYHGTQ